MEVEKLKIPEVLLLKPRIFRDQRGYFFESFNLQAFRDATGVDTEFVQDNESASSRGVLRGLHFQIPPYAQGKLVRVIRGKVFDVAVDIRKKSPTYGHYVGAVLSGDNKHQLYIPPGFAHGFHVLEDHTVFAYKCTGYYHPDSERTLAWNDPLINIDWGTTRPLISDKDRSANESFENLPDYFIL